MITTLTKTFTIAVQGKKEINEVVTLLRILQEFVFTPPSIQWDEIISLKIILQRQDSSLGGTTIPITPEMGEGFMGSSPVLLQRQKENQRGRDSSSHFTRICLYTTIYTMG